MTWNVRNEQGKACFHKTTFGGFKTQRQAMDYHKSYCVRSTRASYMEINQNLEAIQANKDWLVKLAELEATMPKPRTKKTTK
jgi:hypothetical protein